MLGASLHSVPLESQRNVRWKTLVAIGLQRMMLGILMERAKQSSGLKTQFEIDGDEDEDEESESEDGETGSEGTSNSTGSFQARPPAAPD